MKEIRLRIFGEAVIEVGDTEVTPTMSHIFALLLLLSLGPKEGWTRRELMELLFEGVEPKDASHRLRQLLYKLRGMGVELEENRRRLSITMLNQTRDIRAPSASTFLDASSLAVLPKYSPALPAPFREWLETKRDGLAADLRHSIGHALQTCKQAGDWRATARAAHLLRELDPYSSEAIFAEAEALALTDRRNQALRLLDDLCKDGAVDESVLSEARRLRARIGKAVPSHPHSPLVGRDSALTFVGGCWEIAIRSGAHICTLIGAPGMGKTRVAGALLHHIQVLGGRTLHFSCHPDMRDSPYAFFSHALTRLFAQPGSIGIDPEYRATLETLAGRPHSDYQIGDRSVASERRARLQHAFVDLLECVSTDRPIAIVVDDAHWMDDASRRVFDVLCSSSSTIHLLAVLLRRPVSNGASASHTNKVSTYVLPPLTPRESRQLIDAMTQHEAIATSVSDWIVEQSAGNPFYLCTLSRAAAAGLDDTPAPIQSIAASTYHALDGTSRSVLDACLLLDNYATLSRVEAVTGMQREGLLRSFRALEDAGLISFDGGVIQGPHAILQDALRSLIPRSVAGLLHRSIARLVADEAATNFDPALAMAAVRSLLAADASEEAVALGRSCARRAALLGEPAASARLLEELAQHALPPASRSALLEELAAYAESAGLRDISSKALDERLALALSLHESTSVVTDIRLRTMSEAFRGPRAVPNIFAILDIAEDQSLPAALRNRAVCRALTIAFLYYDAAIAERAHAALVRTTETDQEPNRHRADLIYHTVFGDPHLARRLVTTLRKEYSTNPMERTHRDVQCNAAFALMHLGLREEAASIAIRHYEAVRQLGMSREMEYIAGIMSEILIGIGDYQSAKQWVEHERNAATRYAGITVTYSACYYSSRIMLALQAREADEALRILSEFNESYAAAITPRFQAVTFALELRALLILGDYPGSDRLRSLEQLYDQGKMQGGQDGIVEALFLSYQSLGRNADALQLLADYTTSFRRELGPLEAGLSAIRDAMEKKQEPA